MANESPKRRTKTSNEAKLRYNKKTYMQYGIKLKIKEDAEIISFIEKQKENGIPTTEIIRKLLLLGLKNYID